MLFRSALFAVSLCIPAITAQAHEFWISPESYQVAEGEAVVARFRNGENLNGSTLSYIPSRTNRFEMLVDGEVQAIPGRLGDNPAINVEGLGEGLVILAHETAQQSLTYSEWAKWVKFTDHKALTNGQTGHRARGLPDEGFKEAYLRFSKSLVAVGDGAGQDRLVGMRTEIVAGLNPYTDDLSGGLPVQVFLDGDPKAGAQIEMFEKDAEGQVTVTLHMADENGQAILPMRPGREYLLDSVALEALEPEKDGDPVWLTLWAALTFATPQG